MEFSGGNVLVGRKYSREYVCAFVQACRYESLEAQLKAVEGADHV